MEYAKSDCKSITMKSAIKKFVETMHVRPMSKRLHESTASLKGLTLE